MSYDRLLREIENLKRKVERLQTMDAPQATWTAWIPSVIGWSSTNLTRSGHYKIIGDMLYWRVYISGTSNSTYAGFTLPNSAKSIEASHAYWTGAFEAVDNMVILAAPGRWQIGSNATLVNFYKDFASSVWTASGIKTVVAQGIIGIQ